MRNASKQRESKRDNARQLEIELAHKALTVAGFGFNDSSLPDRIKVLVDAHEAESAGFADEVVNNSLGYKKILAKKDTEIAKRDEVIEACKAEVSALTVTVTERDSQLDDVSILLVQSRKAFEERGKTIQQLEKRIAANFQDESLAVRERDEEYETLQALWQQDCELLMMGANDEIKRLKAIIARATNQVTEPINEPDVPASLEDRNTPLPAAPVYFEPPVSDEEKLGSIEIEP